MKILHLIEKHFWIVLLSSLILGISFPIYIDFFMKLLKPELMLMLFLVFLKTDSNQILKRIKNYKLMLYLSVMYLLIVPTLFFLSINLFDRNLAIAILLLTSMPAAMASPALTDIVKGNRALAMSVAIITSLLAPFTVPFLFSIFTFKDIAINQWEMFQTLAMLVFIPMIASFISKKYFPRIIEKTKPSYAAINIIIIFLIVYGTLGSQQTIILNNPLDLVWKIILLYLLAISHHIIGYILGYWLKKEDKIALTVTHAYKNNALAIVLAASYFDPTVLLLMVLSELPWATLLAPFGRVVKYIK